MEKTIFYEILGALQKSSDIASFEEHPVYNILKI